MLSSAGQCGIFQGPLGDPYPGGDAYFDARPNPPGVWVRMFSRLDLPFRTEMVPAGGSAACGEEAGGWHNEDPYTRNITRIELAATCSGDVAIAWNIHVYGACSPTDCDWGTAAATRLPDGRLRAVYTWSWATKTLWIDLLPGSPERLEVESFTDFTPGDGRTDYRRWDRFERD